MKKWFTDAWGDLSSGALMRLAAFVVVLVLLVVGMILAAPVDGLLVLVGEFVAVVVITQAALSIQARGHSALSDESDESLGVLANPDGDFDLGRLIKLAAFVAAALIALVYLIWWRDRLFDGARVAALLLSISTGTDVVQKAAGA